ncbi:Golgi resident protein GCP60-like isoform X2 [Mytilus californianus]|uniref:Golgi resident protein GCP60-like isoform X2 n=1 Tax=Mytilus californianus TaxID=6549 RepID=UPI00224526B9|nr:Golgi resident protein GCP60-like isoform X2 [Mytilus californianus]
MADTDKLASEVKTMTLQNGENTSPDKSSDDFISQWGFPLPDLYKLALRFYKGTTNGSEKDGKAIHLTYKEKLRLVAYTKQAAHGKYRNDVSPDVGFLDVVGNDRRQAWQSLGDMSKESAMVEFIKLVDSQCGLLRPYIEAHKAENMEKIKKQKEAEEQRRREEEEKERKRLEEEAQRQLEMERKRQMEQEMQIRTALNQQTAVQFSQYASQQSPGNKQQQEELIRQLQEQHFQQYMQQVYQQQLLHQQQQYQQLQQNMSSVAPTTTTNNNPNVTTVITKTETKEITQAQQQQMQQQQQQPNGPTSVPTEQPDTNGNKEDHELPPLAAASMWTRKDIKEFKESLRKDKDSVIKIGSGETVTVRVPTHEDGSCLFWEFSTDYYDIGFGVYFEWTVEPSNAVTVHVSESSDEEDLEEEQQENKVDVEQGSKQDNRPPTDEIIPVYRRDCHEEVYCGSHAYPGQGVYLLKFDNSYSLWRSKTLYYRVYYSR